MINYDKPLQVRDCNGIWQDVLFYHEDIVVYFNGKCSSVLWHSPQHLEETLRLRNKPQEKEQGMVDFTNKQVVKIVSSNPFQMEDKWYDILFATPFNNKYYIVYQDDNAVSILIYKEDEVEKYIREKPTKRVWQKWIVCFENGCILTYDTEEIGMSIADAHRGAICKHVRAEFER